MRGSVTAMASSRPITILERVLDDDYVHEQIGMAASGLRSTYRRARHLPPDVAVQDKTVYDHMRTTATGLTNAVKRVAAKPPPEPPRRRRRPLLLVMALAGAVVLLAARRDRELRAAGPPPPSAA